MKVLTNISQALTLEAAFKKDGRNLLPGDLSTIENASIVYDSDKILWVGETHSLPSEYQSAHKIDCSNYCVTPELVDSHTHLVFGGNRANEYVMRLNGADYQAIANAGGGILYTMTETNKLDEDQLFNLAVKRVEKIYSQGVGTIEIKSGYSLTFDGEYKLSKIISKLQKYFQPRVQIFRTYMAAHAVPKSFQSSKEYIELLVIPLMEKLASENLIDAVDIFHEQGYFTTEDVEILFKRAKGLNLKLKSHADEFNDNKGAILACEYGALSCDHLLATTEDGITRLSHSKTVATLLPGTGLFLGKPQADGKKLLNEGAKVALASDYNPGSCHCDNLLMIASLAAPIYKMNITQMWSAITLNAAAALGYDNQGAILVGLRPRFSFFNCKSLSEVSYNWGSNLAANVDYF